MVFCRGRLTPAVCCASALGYERLGFSALCCGKTAADEGPHLVSAGSRSAPLRGAPQPLLLLSHWKRELRPWRRNLLPGVALRQPVHHCGRRRRRLPAAAAATLEPSAAQQGRASAAACRGGPAAVGWDAANTAADPGSGRAPRGPSAPRAQAVRAAGSPEDAWFDPRHRSRRLMTCTPRHPVPEGGAPSDPLPWLGPGLPQVVAALGRGGAGPAPDADAAAPGAGEQLPRSAPLRLLTTWPRGLEAPPRRPRAPRDARGDQAGKGAGVRCVPALWAALERGAIRPQRRLCDVPRGDGLVRTPSAPRGDAGAGHCACVPPSSRAPGVVNSSSSAALRALLSWAPPEAASARWIRAARGGCSGPWSAAGWMVCGRRTVRPLVGVGSAALRLSAAADALPHGSSAAGARVHLTSEEVGCLVPPGGGTGGPAPTQRWGGAGGRPGPLGRGTHPSTSTRAPRPAGLKSRPPLCLGAWGGRYLARPPVLWHCCREADGTCGMTPPDLRFRLWALRPGLATVSHLGSQSARAQPWVRPRLSFGCCSRACLTLPHSEAA